MFVEGNADLTPTFPGHGPRTRSWRSTPPITTDMARTGQEPEATGPGPMPTRETYFTRDEPCPALADEAPASMPSGSPCRHDSASLVVTWL